MDRSGQQPRSAVGGIRPKASPQMRPPTPARVRQIQQLHEPTASRSMWQSNQRSDFEVRERKATQAEKVRQSWLERLRKNVQLLCSLQAPKGTDVLVRLMRWSTTLVTGLAILMLQQETDGFANSASDIA
ncbi:hypothetical protein IFM51744_10542 [Aspergillus udagawae]|nr:hypothetical protein IFM51744_10542 [Aspergillus udagawae]